MFPINPIKDTTYIVNGIEYIYDGNGFIPKGKEEKPQETDPVYNQEKGQFIKRSELPLPSDIAVKGDIPDVSNLASKDDIPVVDNFALKAQYAETYFRNEVEYKGDYIKLKDIGQNKLYIIKKLIVRTSFGDKIVDAKVVYNFGDCYLFSNFLSKSANWEFFVIKYDIINNPRTYPPDLRGKIGRNFMLDVDSVGSHSTTNRKIFKSVHSQLSTYPRQALESAVVEGKSISYDETDEMAVKHKFNILARPYMRGAISEETSSCPDILSVGAHYGNYFYEGGSHNELNSDESLNTGARKDITPDENTFLNNSIAISAGTNLDGTGRWTSYGYGVEFFEAYNIEQMDAQLPERNYYTPSAGVTIPDVRTVKASGTHKIKASVGDTFYVHYSDINIVEFKVAEVVSETEVKSDRDLPIQTTLIYIWNYTTVGRLFGGNPQQSATCSIVAAKLAAIQDLTDANWQIVREAARMTASNATSEIIDGKTVYTPNWDMRRGFGRIDVAKAVSYIKENYSENQEYLDSVIPQLPRYNPFLKLEDLDDENPVTKKMVKGLDNDIKVVKEGLGGKAEHGYGEGEVVPTLKEVDNRIDTLENAEAKPSTVFINSKDNTTEYSLWVGTQEEYDAIITKSDTTIYTII